MSEVLPDSAIIGLAGIAFGALLAGGMSLLRDAASVHRRTLSVEAAIAAEIRSEIFRASVLQIDAPFRKALSDIKAGRDTTIPSIIGLERAPEKVWPIFYSHMNEIGLLPAEQVGRIVIFYSSLEMLQRDIIYFSENQKSYSAEEKIVFLQDILTIFESSISSGIKVTYEAGLRGLDDFEAIRKKYL